MVEKFMCVQPYHITTSSLTIRIIQADTYEVLIPAFQPARYRISDSDGISHIPRMHRIEPATDSIRYPGVERLK